MQNFIQDLRFGFRTLGKNIGFTAIIIIVLAIGIGANTAIFSVVNTVLLRSFPYKDPETLVKPASASIEKEINPENSWSVCYSDYLDWRNESVFDAVAIYSIGNADITGQGEPERINLSLVSEDYFTIMGGDPIIGRVFSDEENKGAGSSVAVISFGLWQRKFGGNQNIINQSITVNGRAISIIGVMPRNSQYPETVDAWVPLNRVIPKPDADILRRDNFIFQAIARLKKGVSIDQVNTHLATIAQRIEQDNPGIRNGVTARAFPLQEWIVGTQLRRALFVLLGAVGFVLLIVCVNIANLLLSRAATREREVAIRLTLGAGRWRLIQQFLTESLLLGVLGGTIGWLLALWGVDLLVSFAPSDIPRLKEVGADWRVLGFTFSLSILTAIVIGLIPALRSTKADLSDSLKEGGRTSSTGLRGQHIRNLLVVIEVALSLVLLIGAGLMMKSFRHLQQVELGFNGNNVLTFDIGLTRLRFKEPGEIESTYRQISERIKNVPGVESVTFVSALPLNGGGFYLGRAFLREGQNPPPAGEEYNAMWNVVSPEYFDTMKIGVIKGRAFTEQDTAKSPPVVIINESLARQMFPGEDPLGKRLKSWRDENLLREIVGVVSDVRYQSRDEKPVNLVYVPHTQNTWSSMTLAVRTAGDPAGLTNAIREAVWGFDKDLAVANVQTMAKVINDSSARPRFNTLLLSLFAVIAMLLAAVGIYGVMSYMVTQRTHEIGIRMALGAKTSDVLKMVVQQGMRLALAGVSFGLLAAFALMRLLASLLYNTSYSDTVTFLVVSFILAGVALLACFVPALRAAKTNPIVALRYE